MRTDTLSRTLHAISDPTRRAILSRLAVAELGIKELAEPFNLSLPAVTKHVKVLEDAGLVEKSVRAQWRPCRLKAEGLTEVAEWIKPYVQVWNARFDRLENYISETAQSSND